ncbi:hypothetical protein K474DRAFT_1669404 [Panus rudis PR-1116 ss-1]|nr:hypothetical protein K474DRAFT_1669404 [Panus rudis PR-1116 ss-1]
MASLREAGHSPGPSSIVERDFRCLPKEAEARERGFDPAREEATAAALRSAPTPESSWTIM